LDIYNNPSEIRNHVLAPIFKELDLIEQWGSGMKKIRDEMKNYPELELRINELGNAAQFQFIKSNYVDIAHDTAHDVDTISKQEKI
jgi:ATP-dependent DNA helicase RecG